MKIIVKICALFMLFLLPHLFFGQVSMEKKYFNQKGEKSDSIDAATIQYWLFSDSLKKSGTIRTIDVLGNLISDIEYGNMSNFLKEGKSVYYYEDGKIKAIENYSNGKLEGSLISYYENGSQIRDDVFENGVLISGKCYTTSGADTAYFDYQKAAEYKGGDIAMNAFLIRNINYPKKAMEKKIAGTVYLNFIVEKNGTVSDIVVLNKVNELLKTEAVRVVKLMKDWEPAILEGKPVRVRYTLPITFKLR